MALTTGGFGLEPSCRTLLGMGWAAWMDHKERRVSNNHWLVWVKPAIFIWCLELAREADWTIYLNASVVIAYASVAIIGRPTIKDVLRQPSRCLSIALVLGESHRNSCWNEQIFGC